MELVCLQVGCVKRKEEHSNGGSWIRDLLGRIGLEVGADLVKITSEIL